MQNLGYFITHIQFPLHYRFDGLHQFTLYGIFQNIAGRLSVIIASAPDEQQFRKQFPKADTKLDNDLLPMYGYNKFAVGKNDLPGTWSNSGAAL